MKKSAMAVLVFMVVFVSHLVFAGNIDSPGPPSEESKMPSLLDIYDYLNLGTQWTDSGNFTEPAAGPGSTMKTTKEIYDDNKAKFDSCNATASDVATTKKFFSTQPGNWGVKTGTGLISTGDAVVADVLHGKTFSNAGSAGLTGTMTNNGGGGTITPGTTDQAIAAGYWSSANTVKGDADLNATNIKNVKELSSLIDFAYYDPALSNDAGTDKWGTGLSSFSGVQLNYYWSSTASASAMASAWYVSLSHGDVYSGNKTWKFYVWPVRGGQ